MEEKIRWSDCELNRLSMRIETVYEVIHGAREKIRLHHVHTSEMECETVINTEKKEKRKTGKLLNMLMNRQK